jgi:isoleucyl-tRNA synthetase
MDPLDRWALSRLQRVVEISGEAFEVYDFHRAAQAILLFCTTDLSAFYLDVLKDRLYTSLPDDPKRRSSQTALHEIASVLCRLLAPVLVHTCEEVWAALPAAGAKCESVHLFEDPALGAEDVTVTIAPAPGRKCDRSWFVLEDVGSDPEYPTLSARQAAIVRELERRQQIA